MLRVINFRMYVCMYRGKILWFAPRHGNPWYYHCTHYRAALYSKTIRHTYTVHVQHDIKCWLYTGWPNKNHTFFEIPYFYSHYRDNYAVFAEVFRNYSRKQQATFFKQVLNILCEATGNGLRHTRLLDDDQPGLGWHCHRPVLKTTYPGHSCSGWTYWASPELGLIRHTRIVIKLCGILQN